MKLTTDMKAVIHSAHLCFAATVAPDGSPNVSPKGTVRVWDDESIFFLDIASPGTRRNLAHNPHMELNVVDQISRRGYRFFGEAAIHESGPTFDRAQQIIWVEERAPYKVRAVITLRVERAAPLMSPGYSHVADETEMRKSWYKRRAELDRQFEEHLRGREPFRATRN